MNLELDVPKIIKIKAKFSLLLNELLLERIIINFNI